MIIPPVMLERACNLHRKSTNIKYSLIIMANLFSCCYSTCNVEMKSAAAKISCLIRILPAKNPFPFCQKRFANCNRPFVKCANFIAEIMFPSFFLCLSLYLSLSLSVSLSLGLSLSLSFSLSLCTICMNECLLKH